MTKPRQKCHERFVAERAAESLGVRWSIGPDRENPDFIVSDGEATFGLELREVFAGSTDQSGSAMKRLEAEKQEAVNAVRREYDAAEKPRICPLNVRFVGDMTPENMAMIAPALLAQNLPEKPIGHHDVIDTHNGLRVHFTKAFRPDWFTVNDRVGWVDRNPIDTLKLAIREKSAKLPTYRANAGSDVRLLLFADRLYNSGKIILEEDQSTDTFGFTFVYFYSYPEPVVVFAA